jgi:hypothetical protein
MSRERGRQPNFLLDLNKNDTGETVSNCPRCNSQRESTRGVGLESIKSAFPGIVGLTLVIALIPIG